ncbi:unnamed protein product [Ceratitis capitata]|uniref:(Mediterranean fruit fly) hypothetical protein n=1 Tax=Ceratitis capitata TaxID=7213 RepID=A0A811UV65_CERCA|nr:unnamed protein product [Ceratitis capitata]
MSDNQRPLPPVSSQSEELAPPKADFSAPPPYELTNSNNSNNMGGDSIPQGYNLIAQQQQPPPMLQVSLPPINAPTNQPPTAAAATAAATATVPATADMMMVNRIVGGGGSIGVGDMPIMQHTVKLPTYEEVQMEKSLNGELPPPFMNAHMLPPLPPPNPLLAHIREGGNMPNSRTTATGTTPALTFIAIDASEAENLTSNSDNGLLGTDAMFILAFMVAFLFNWIGFLMLTCFCHTIAARYGALSGFGLSLAKWTLIVKNSTELASHENSWLWWLIMAFGFLICIRAFIQYVSIKRTWRLLSTSAQERLLFFY